MSTARPQTQSVPTVLIVDDSRVQREVLKVYLMARTFNVVEASSGKSALEYILRNRVALALVDVRMPELDGPGLCRALAALPQVSTVPVLILTAQDDALTRDACLEAGAREVLLKPVSPDVLLAAIDRWISKP